MNLLSFFSRKKYFIDILKDHFLKTGVGLKDSTKEKHSYFLANIEKYLHASGISSIRINQVHPSHMESLRVWLYENTSCSKGHASRHLKHCKAAFKLAVKMGHYSHNPIENVETEKDKINEPVSLTPPEIKKLLHADFDNRNFDLVADLFLFQCFTGLSYMDLWAYKIVRENGMNWITNPDGRGKNGHIYWVEFNEYAKDIHDKYSGSFPEITNQSYNRTIKKIALRLGINKQLSTHDARKTFATLKYKQGHSLESISDQLGNNPETTRKHYITKGNERVKAESERLREAPFLNFATN